MKLSTKSFGVIEFEENKKIIFNEGIPGFKELKHYIIIEDEDEKSPFAYLQSIENTEISFVIANPYYFKQDYTIHVKDSVTETLGGKDANDFAVFAIVTITSSFQDATLNLLAPLIIHNDTRKGIQYILENTEYTTKHKIVDLLEERG